MICFYFFDYFSQNFLLQNNIHIRPLQFMFDLVIFVRINLLCLKQPYLNFCQIIDYYVIFGIVNHFSNPTNNFAIWDSISIFKIDPAFQ